ncbi:hypothetical protein CEUSTIGMA_g7955.t1 [Chlamydomonas eustigma]|uniref:Uncharacterized protein n=1 Tax=Chlamydomonas eustigma TaxID=1157962 RepID=A0A250XBQ8_9CHLO|nr:hypothetical protein CEUSTIGMA_g7955.t1 [Chlamydomonas eustigma]|eukprot:GAX80517.1 hypothetical protein CEUSTIGMA_g7955.t1 [Chlamydomonas eustigma]
MQGRSHHFLRRWQETREENQKSILQSNAFGFHGSFQSEVHWCVHCNWPACFFAAKEISPFYEHLPGVQEMFKQHNIAVAVKPKTIDSPSKPILIRTLNVSCQCDRLDTTKNMVGMIVYSHQGLNEWYLNGIHAKSGYIVVKETDKLYELQRTEGGGGSLHSLLYKLVFGQAPGPGDMASGFSIQKGNWVFNSGTLNVDYESREMPVSEQKLIKTAILKRFGPGGFHADKIYPIKDMANSIAVLAGDFVGSAEDPLAPEDDRFDSYDSYDSY